MKIDPNLEDVVLLDDREDNPLVVETHHESVVIVGPQGVSLALTPEAAIASADVLLEAAAEAVRI
jgi:hypothetical protein